jgi:hypothetical protein
MSSLVSVVRHQILVNNASPKYIGRLEHLELSVAWNVINVFSQVFNAKLYNFAVLILLKYFPSLTLREINCTYVLMSKHGRKYIRNYASKV